MKWWLDSTTIRGALLAIIPTMVFFGKAVGVEIVPEELEQIIDAIIGVIGAISVVMVIIGRFNAKSDLTLTK